MLEARGRDPVSRGRAEHEVPCARLPLPTLQEQFSDLTVQRQPDRGRHRLVGDPSNDLVAEPERFGRRNEGAELDRFVHRGQQPAGGLPQHLSHVRHRERRSEHGAHLHQVARRWRQIIQAAGDVCSPRPPGSRRPRQQIRIPLARAPARLLACQEPTELRQCDGSSRIASSGWWRPPATLPQRESGAPPPAVTDSQGRSCTPQDQGQPRTSCRGRAWIVDKRGSASCRLNRCRRRRGRGRRSRGSGRGGSGGCCDEWRDGSRRCRSCRRTPDSRSAC